MKKLLLALALVVAAGCSSTAATSSASSPAVTVNPDQAVERIEVFNVYSPAER
jgi:hypothetical protein